MMLMLLWFIVSSGFPVAISVLDSVLLVLVVAVAIPCSWLAVEMKAARRQEEAVAAIEKLGGNVSYDWQLDAGGNLTSQRTTTSRLVAETARR